MLNKPYAERVTELRDLYKHFMDLKDSTVVISEIEQIENLARREKDDEMLLEMQLFRAYYHSASVKDGHYKSSLNQLLSIAKQAKEKNIKNIQIRAYRNIAEIYWNHIKDYELAFEYYILLENMLNEIHPENYPDMAEDLLRVGMAYYFFQDYPRANSYFEKVIVIPETEFNTLAISSAKNTLGLYYQKIQDYDTSDDYFRSVLTSPFQKSVEQWEGIAKGNLGANLYYRGKYEEAVPLLEFDYKKAEQVNDYGLAAGAMTILADIYLKKNQLSTSKEFIDKTRTYIQKANAPDRLRLLFPVMSKWYGASGHTALSDVYLDSAVIALKKYSDKFSALKILRAEQKNNRQQRILEQARFDLEKQKSVFQKSMMIGIIILLLAGASFYYLSEKKKQKIKDLQLQISRQELETAHKELMGVLSQLSKTTRSLSEKNKLIEQLQEHSGQAKDAVIAQLQQSMILTGEDWIEFQSLFEKAYPGFIEHLKKIPPKLTPAEIRLLLLFKLKFSLKEISHILGISYDSARVSWYRMIRKLGQPSNISPTELLELITAD